MRAFIATCMFAYITLVSTQPAVQVAAFVGFCFSVAEFVYEL